MNADERRPDDDVLRRVAAARPAMREEDLSPTGERASAIADRVIRSPGAAERGRGNRQRRRRRGPVTLGALALMAGAAALCVVLLSPAKHRRASNSPRQATADVVHIDIRGSKLTLSQRFALARTPLGAQVARQFQAVQETIHTGGVAENRRVIMQLTANAAACDAAATAVEHVHPRPGQDAFQRYWALGIRLQATSDRQYISALRDFDAGRRAAGERQLNLASDTGDRDDLLTGWAEQGLMGSAGPFPRIALRPNP